MAGAAAFDGKVSDKTPEQFAARIMNLLQAEPAGSPSSSTKKSMSRDAAALEQTAGFNTPGYTSPRSASPGSQRSEPASVTGSKKELSPQSAQSQPVQKRMSRSPSQDVDAAVFDVPFVTSAHIRVAQCSAESAMSTDSTSASDRSLRKLQKRRKEIQVLQEQSTQRTLTDQEQAKVRDLAELESQIRLLTVHTPHDLKREPSSGSARSAAPTMPAAARVASELTASLGGLDALVLPPTRIGTRHSAIEVERFAQTHASRVVT